MLTPKNTPLTNLGHRPESGRCSVKSNGTSTYGDPPPKIGPIGRSVSSKVAQIDRVSMTFFKFPLVIHQPCAMRQFYFISDIYPHTAISAKKTPIFIAHQHAYAHRARYCFISLSVCPSVCPTPVLCVKMNWHRHTFWRSATGISLVFTRATHSIARSLLRQCVSVRLSVRHTPVLYLND